MANIDEMLQQRNDAIAVATQVLPGSIPYDNLRPINVSQRFDGLTLMQTVCQAYPHIDQHQWNEWFAAGHILFDGQVVSPTRTVRGGQQYMHLFPGTVEPDVNASIQVVFEDNDLVVVDKPAPLPMHPSGRFNKNTLIWIVRSVYQGERLRPTHRLDANTTGMVVLARNAEAARNLRKQFDAGTIKKTYLARCIGHPPDDHFVNETPIGRQRGTAGRRVTDANGKPATTLFVVLQRSDDGTSEVLAQPITGRTNQIRIHLWQSGFPIYGDPMYLPDGKLGQRQTRRPTDPVMHLHAHCLQITHPTTGQPIEFKSNSINGPFHKEAYQVSSHPPAQRSGSDAVAARQGPKP